MWKHTLKWSFHHQSPKNLSSHLNTVKMHLCSVGTINLLKSPFNKGLHGCLLSPAFCSKSLWTFQCTDQQRFQKTTNKRRGQPCAWSVLPPKQHRVINPELWSTVAPTKQLCHHNPRELQGGSTDPRSHSQATTANTNTHI